MNSSIKLASDSENLDNLFKLLKALHKHYNVVNVVNYIMALAVRPIIKTLEDIIFKDPDISKLYSNLKISIKKDQSFNFIVQNVPAILKKCINNVLISAQNLTMLRASEPELFSACLSGEVNLSLFFSEEKVRDYLLALKKVFLVKREKLYELFIKFRNQEETRRLEELHRKLDKLRAISLDFENEKARKGKLKEMRKFMNNQLQNYLLDQMKTKEISNKYSKGLEREFEKKLLNDQKWIEIQKEKDKMKEEMQKLGMAADEEINLLLKEKEIKDKEWVDEWKLVEAEEKKVQKEEATDSNQQAGRDAVATGKRNMDTTKVTNSVSGTGNLPAGSKVKQNRENVDKWKQRVKDKVETGVLND